MFWAVVSAFAEWQNFYVIIGSAAAALTGLMFVAVVLSAQTIGGGTRRTTDTFNTPTVAYFCGVIFIAATLSAPWHERWHAAVVLGASGILGILYALVVVWRLRGLSEYQVVLEDWAWYAALPLVACVALVGAAIVLPVSTTPALFVIGAAALALLFTGIHNAWDIVTFIAIERVQPPGADER